MPWIDISVPLRNGMVAWPGDARFERTSTLEIAKGDECNLSQISATAHIGTHMDAPRHYLEGAAGIETMPITASIGRARVIEIHDPEAIRTAELEPHHLAKGERILFKTRNSMHCWKTTGTNSRFLPGTCSIRSTKSWWNWKPKSLLLMSGSSGPSEKTLSVSVSLRWKASGR